MEGQGYIFTFDLICLGQHIMSRVSTVKVKRCIMHYVHFGIVTGILKYPPILYKKATEQIMHIFTVLSCASISAELFRQYCCSYYGSPLWPLQSDGVESLCVAWIKALRIIWRVHPQTHSYVIAALSGQKPLILNLRARFVKIFNNVLNMITM